MSQYRKGYALLISGSNVIASTGAIWDDSVIRYGTSVLTLESNVGYYFINSSSGPDVNGNYLINLSAPYEPGVKSSCTGYQRYAITNSFTPNLGLPLIEKGDINAAANFSAALYKLDDVYHSIQLTGSAYLDPKLNSLSGTVNDTKEYLISLINQLSGNLSSGIDSNYYDLLNESGQYLLNYIDNQVYENFSGLSNQVEYLSVRNTYLSNAITGVSTRVSTLENSIFDSGELAGNLENYCNNIIENLSGEFDLSLYNQIKYITGQFQNTLSGINVEISDIYDSTQDLIAQSYSYKINSISGILSNRIIDSGNILYNDLIVLSGIVNTISITGSNISFGTLNNTFYIGPSGSYRTILNNNGWILDVRNGYNSDYNNIKIESLYLKGDYIYFSDDTYLNELNGLLYYNGERIATQNWTTGNFAIYNSLLTRIEALESGSEVFFSQAISPSNQSEYQISYNKTYANAPTVFTQLCGNGTDPAIAYYINRVTTNNFYINFANTIPSNNYTLNVWAKSND